MAYELKLISQPIENPIPPISVPQLDTGHILRFFLKDEYGGVDETINLNENTITLVVRKPSGLYVVIAGDVIDGDGGECQVQLTEQALAETGKCEAQLILTDVDTIRTLIFTLEVTPSLDPGDDIESVAEYSALQTALTEVNAAITTVATLDTMTDTIADAYSVYLQQGGSLPIDEWLAGFTGDPPPLIEMDSRDAYLAAKSQGQTNPNYIYYWGF